MPARARPSVVLDIQISQGPREPFAFTGAVKKVVFNITPHLTEKDELDVHTAEQHGKAGHALSE